MKIAFAIIISAFVLVTARPTDACNSCAGWGRSEAAREAVCADPSAGLRDALNACQRANCAVECAAYLASYDDCVASGPPCDIYVSLVADDCDFCTRGTWLWAGIGCEAENKACSDDTTGCSSCAEWIGGIGDIDNLCWQPGVSSLSVAIDFIGCACDGACKAACSATSCPEGWLDLSLPMDDACAQCLQDTGAGCGDELQVCAGL